MPCVEKNFNIIQLENALLLAGYIEENGKFIDKENDFSIAFNKTNIVFKSKKGTTLLFINPEELSIKGLRETIQKSFV